MQGFEILLQGTSRHAASRLCQQHLPPSIPNPGVSQPHALCGGCWEAQTASKSARALRDRVSYPGQLYVQLYDWSVGTGTRHQSKRSTYPSNTTSIFHSPWNNLRQRSPPPMRLPPPARTAHQPRVGSGARLGQVGCCPSFPSCAPPPNTDRDPAAIPSRPTRLSRPRHCRYHPSLRSLPTHPITTYLPPILPQHRCLTYSNIRQRNKKHDDVGGLCGKLRCSDGVLSGSDAKAGV